jgi:hypothetical protein
MDGMNLGLMIISAIRAIGLLQVIAWAVVVIGNPSSDLFYARP